MTDKQKPLEEAGDPERKKYYEIWGITKNEYLIMATKDFVVFLDGELDLDWQITTEFSARLKTGDKWPEDMNEVLNRAAMLQSYPVSRLTKTQQKDFRRMVGEGLARAFCCDVKNAMVMLNKAGEFAEARNQELARGWYLLSTGLTTLVFIIIMTIFWIFKTNFEARMGHMIFGLMFVSFAGALGAFFSILTRVGKTPLDSSAGVRAHFLEGVGRIFVGVFAALIAQCAVKLGLILAILSDKGSIGLLLIALVAGASERLVPTIIKKVEMHVGHNTISDK